MKILKTAALLGAGAAIGAVALGLAARRAVTSFIEDPSTIKEDTALLAGAIVAQTDAAQKHVEQAGQWIADALNGQRPGPSADEIGFHRRQAAEAAGIQLPE